MEPCWVGTPGKNTKRKAERGSTTTQTRGDGSEPERAGFKDTFNVEVTVTLMLNMLDEVTNTVQLIKSDYAGKKKTKKTPKQTKANRDTSTDSAPSLTPRWSGHPDLGQVMQVVEAGLRILPVRGCCVTTKQKPEHTNIHIHTVHTNISVNLSYSDFNFIHNHLLNKFWFIALC